MARNLVFICERLMMYADVLDALYAIYGPKTAEVMLYSTILISAQRGTMTPKLKRLAPLFKRYDPVNLLEMKSEMEFERAMKKLFYHAIRSEVQRVVARAFANALKNVRGIDVDAIIEKTAKELDGIFGLNEIEKLASQPPKSDIPQK